MASPFDRLTGQLPVELLNALRRDADDGPMESTALYLTEQESDPAAAIKKGILYTKNDNGITKLFYRDADGVINEVGAGSVSAENLGDVYIYVRNTGNDTTGDGSLANPFLTIQHALDTIPLFISRGTRYFVECTGLGLHAVAGGIVMPPFQSSNDAVFDFTPGADLVIVSPVNIVAIPTTLDTITAGEHTGTTADAISDLQTIQTNKTFVVDEHRGKMLMGSGFLEVAAIQGNSATDLYINTPSYTTWTAPIKIVEPSTEIQNSTAFDFGNSLRIQDNHTWLTIHGLKFTHISSFTSLGIADTFAIWATFCDITGPFFDVGLLTANFNACVFRGNCDLRAQSLGVSGLFDTASFTQTGPDGHKGIWVSFGAMFRACTSGLFDYFVDRSEFRLFLLGNVDFLNSPGLTFSGGMCSLTEAKFTGCTRSPIIARNPGRLLVRNIGDGGGNAGYGLEIHDGAQVLVRGTNTVSGASGAIKSGAQPVSSWAVFDALGPPANIADTGLAASELCRVFRE